MNYVAVKDLKRTRDLWELLEVEKELVITRDGKPCALLIGVSPEMAHESISEIRRAMFSVAVRKARQAAQDEPLPPGTIENAIAESRRERGIS